MVGNGYKKMAVEERIEYFAVSIERKSGYYQ